MAVTTWLFYLFLLSAISCRAHAFSCPFFLSTRKGSRNTAFQEVGGSPKNILIQNSNHGGPTRFQSWSDACFRLHGAPSTLTVFEDNDPEDFLSQLHPAGDYKVYIYVEGRVFILAKPCSQKHGRDMAFHGEKGLLLADIPGDLDMYFLGQRSLNDILLAFQVAQETTKRHTSEKKFDIVMNNCATHTLDMCEELNIAADEEYAQFVASRLVKSKYIVNLLKNSPNLKELQANNNCNQQNTNSNGEKDDERMDGDPGTRDLMQRLVNRYIERHGIRTTPLEHLEAAFL